MKGYVEHKQLYVSDKEAGTVGDCWRTCIACLLGVEPSTVPHFLLEAYDKHGYDNEEAVSREMHESTATWLLENYGMALTMLKLPAEATDNFTAQWAALENGAFMLGGVSSRGYGHVVISDGNEFIAFDPHPAADGILDPDPNGTYDIFVLTHVHNGKPPLKQTDYDVLQKRLNFLLHDVGFDAVFSRRKEEAGDLVAMHFSPGLKEGTDSELEMVTVVSPTKEECIDIGIQIVEERERRNEAK